MRTESQPRYRPVRSSDDLDTDNVYRVRAPRIKPASYVRLPVESQSSYVELEREGPKRKPGTGEAYSFGSGPPGNWKRVVDIWPPAPSRTHI